MAIIITNTPIPITLISRSCSVRRDVFSPLPPLIPLIESAKVFTIKGNVLIRLIIPPAATAPAPI